MGGNLGPSEPVVRRLRFCRSTQFVPQDDRTDRDDGDAEPAPLDGSQIRDGERAIHLTKLRRIKPERVPMTFVGLKRCVSSWLSRVRSRVRVPWGAKTSTGRAPAVYDCEVERWDRDARGSTAGGAFGTPVHDYLYLGTHQSGPSGEFERCPVTNGNRTRSDGIRSDGQPDECRPDCDYPQCDGNDAGVPPSPCGDWCCRRTGGCSPEEEPSCAPILSPAQDRVRNAGFRTVSASPPSFTDGADVEPNRGRWTTFPGDTFIPCAPRGTVDEDLSPKLQFAAPANNGWSVPVRGRVGPATRHRCWPSGRVPPRDYDA